MGTLAPPQSSPGVAKLRKRSFDRSSIIFVTLVVAIAAILGGLMTCREPLWIDELHTFWSVSGRASQIVPRASLGNQSSLWFFVEAAWLHFASWLQLPATLLIRLPSLIAWATMAAVCVWKLLLEYQSRDCTTGRVEQQFTAPIRFALLLAILIGCDQISWFYSIEARPYAAVALAIAIAATSTHSRVLFVLYCVLAVYLHYTASFVVVGLIIARTLTTDKLKRCVQDSVVIAVLLIPALYSMFQIGQRRELWASFAGDISPMQIWSILPWFAWLLPISLAAWFCKLDIFSDRRLQFLLIAVTVTMALVLMLTWFQIAPLMHARYLIGVYPLLLLVAGTLLQRIGKLYLQLGSVLTAAALWSATFGGPAWLRGEGLISWQRHENWPLLLQTLEQQQRRIRNQSSARLYFAPMLIETSTIATMQRYDSEYLKFPLTATLAFEHWQQSQPVSSSATFEIEQAIEKAKLLTADPSSWPLEIISETDGSSEATNILIAARASAHALKPHLENLLQQINHASANSTAEEGVWRLEWLLVKDRLTLVRVYR